MTELAQAEMNHVLFANMANTAMITSEARYSIQRDLTTSFEVSDTYSSFRREVLTYLMVDAERFAQQVGAIYGALAQDQERLDRDVEDAIFSDLEGLHDS